MANPRGNPQNLKPRWVKGQSGNPSGRSRDVLTQAVRKLMTDDEAESLVQTIIMQAKQGDMRAAELLWNRIEGKAIDRKEVGQPGDFDASNIPDDKLRSLLDLADKSAA